MPQTINNLSETWNNAGTTFTALKFNVTDTASNAASLLMDLQVGGASRLSVRKDGLITSGSTFIGGPTFFGVVSGNTGLNYSNQGAVITGGGGFQFAGASIDATDLALRRDSADILAQRRTTNAQTFRIYNTFTDASNYERGFMKWNSNVLEIGMDKAGTGANRLLRFTSENTTASAWEFRSSGTQSPTLVLAGSDRSVTLSPQINMLAANGGFASYLDYSAGATTTHSFRGVNSNSTVIFFGLSGIAAGVMQLSNGLGRGFGFGAAMEMVEMTAPASPAANGVRLYAEDDGAGKTRLMALFATGAAQQLAIEP